MDKLGTYISNITVTVNTDSQAGYSLHVPSDESVKKLNDWFFSHDFGEWKAESFEEAHYTVFHFSLSNKNDNYDNSKAVVDIINKAAKSILQKLN